MKFTYTSKQVIAALITVLLLALLATACIATYNIVFLSLPISRVTAIASILIPILNGVGIIGGGKFHAARASKRSSNRRKGGTAGIISWPTIISFVVLAIYETVVATVAFSHMIPPDGLICHMSPRWSRLYSSKDVTAIRRIQDAHQCCGLASPKDKAWPFMDKTHGSDACIEAFGWHKGCLIYWRRDERIYAALLFFVALTTLGLKIVFVIVPVVRGSDWWVERTTGQGYPALIAAGDHHGLESGSGNETNANEIRGRIEGAYRDNPIEESDEEDLARQPTIEAATNRSDNQGVENRAPVLQPSRLHIGHNEWAHESE